MPNNADSDSADPIALAQAARLTAAFYAWEERGRGWQVWDTPVQLEPPFRPFLFHDSRLGRVHDDGRKPGRFALWLDHLFGIGNRDLSVGFSSEEGDEPEPEPSTPRSLVEMQVTLSADIKISPDSAEHLLLNLSACSGPVSFEVVATSQAIVVQFACIERDAPHVREQLRAYFPDAVISDGPGLLAARWNDRRGRAVIVDFGLSHEFMRPLKTFTRFDTDPLIGIMGALSELEGDEVGILQVLFEAVQSPWTESIIRSVTDWQGKAFFVDAPELTTHAEEKVERPLFAAVIRVAAKSPESGRPMQIIRRVGGALVQVSCPTSNELIALANDDYPDDTHLEDLLARQTRRSGCILNSEELVGLVHLPSSAVRAPRLKRDDRRTKAAPDVAVGHALILGENTHSGRTRTISVSNEHRLRHMHIVGASGTGKSTLLLRLISQDMEQGQGLALLDPHGDLVDDVLARVPEDRMEDVILIDPADVQHPVAFNILSAHSEPERTILSSDLVALFRRLSTSWGDQMTSVLSNAVLAFLESSRGGTLADLRRFLVEAEFRKAFLDTVADQEVVYYWQKEFPLLTGKPQAPLLTRLDAFLRPKLIRAMVTQPENRLDFASIMNDGKILLVKLAQGAIGEENAALLGTLFVAKFNQLALSRQSVAEQERRPFYLYLDEFQHFVTPSMATMLTGARKYRIGLILAHQELRQLWNQDRDVAGAVLANAATRVSFRVGDDDAKKLEDGFSIFTARNLQNLGIGEAVCRIDRADWDFSLDTQALPSIDPEVATTRRARVVASFRERYGLHHATAPPSPGVVVPPQESSMPVSAAATPATPTRRTQGAVAARSRPQTFINSLSETELSVLELPTNPALGRGGAQHKYLQELIRRWAHANGWQAVIEQPILDGLGSVDVALSRGNHSIACEVSALSNSAYEVSNIQKCLVAGFTHVVSVVLNKRTLQKLQKLLVETLVPEDVTRVAVLQPDDLFTFLDQLSVEPQSAENTVRGYKVRLSFRKTADAGARARSVTQTIAGALKRLRP